MTPAQFERVSQLFLRLSEEPIEARRRRLDEWCPDDAEVREAVRAMFDAERSGGDTLGVESETPTVLPAVPDTGEAETTEVPERIGRYRVTGVLGRGGMGVVYEAQQDLPNRTVALKMMRRGLATAEALRRFQLEAESLARIDHPGVARVYEVGSATVGGRDCPYFAMELIRGALPVGAFAERHGLDASARLGLVIQACEALQRGHLSGLIHRDVKPDNLLVDAEGALKVIDFGVARATDADIQTVTLRTDVGQLIGTLPYMSPEQVAADPDRIDTRSDVYSLGVVTHELLTGRLPYAVRGSSIAEAARIIRDDAPTRLSATDASLRGDLESIVLKSLEKDPADRYQSAGELAQDLRRFLRDEPVLARPHSAAYRFRRFARRNRAIVAVGSLGIAALVAGLIGTTAGLFWALSERDTARGALIAEAIATSAAQDSATASERDAAIAEGMIGFLLSDVLGAADPARGDQHDLTVREALLIASENVSGRFDAEPEVEIRVRGAIARTLEQIGSFAEAEPHHHRNIELLADLNDADSTRVTDVQISLTTNLMYRGRFDDAIGLCGRVVARLRDERPGGDPQLVRLLGNLGVAYLQTGRATEAAPILAETLAAKRRDLGDDDPSTLSSIHNLAGLHGMLGNRERALALAREAYERRSGVLGTADPRTYASLGLYADTLVGLDRNEDAAVLLEAAIDDARIGLGPAHFQTNTLTKTLAAVEQRLGRLASAESRLRGVAETIRATLGEDHPEMMSLRRQLAVAIQAQGRSEEAIPIFERALEQAEAALGAGDNLAVYLDSIGRCRTSLGRFDAAESALLRAVEMVSAPHRTQRMRESLVELYEAWHEAAPAGGHDVSAERWRAAMDGSAPD